MYWFEEDEHNVLLWLSADTIQQYKLYRKLLQPIREVVLNVSQRYFAVPNHTQTQYINECINSIFVDLQNYNYTKGRAFSYVSRLAKNWYYDIMVAEPQRTKVPRYEYSEDIDTYSEAIEYQPKEPINVDAVLKRLGAIKAKVVHEHSLIEMGAFYTVRHRKYCGMETVLDYCMEFLLKYENFDTMAVHDYCLNKTGYNRGTLAHYFNLLFGMFTGRKDEDREQKRDKKYSYVIDDHPEIDAEMNYSYRLKRKENKYLYF